MRIRLEMWSWISTTYVKFIQVIVRLYQWMICFCERKSKYSPNSVGIGQTRFGIQSKCFVQSDRDFLISSKLVLTQQVSGQCSISGSYTLIQTHGKIVNAVEKVLTSRLILYWFGLFRHVWCFIRKKTDSISELDRADKILYGNHSPFDCNFQWKNRLGRVSFFGM